MRVILEDPVAAGLAVRRLRTGEAKDPDDDTWFLATDVPELKAALPWYALRFQIEEMFRDLKSHLNMDRHRLGTEQSVGKMMLIVALAYLVVLEDGTQWRARVALDRIQKSTAWGALSVYGIARACFEAALPEAPADVAEIFLAQRHSTPGFSPSAPRSSLPSFPTARRLPGHNCGPVRLPRRRGAPRQMGVREGPRSEGPAGEGERPFVA